ncbi:MAG: hypothetical protein HC860_12580 [Alkalinema sp. RU_4_3]|nr:hypothetical protein [Alkalinema sp. RU_4_3]
MIENFPSANIQNSSFEGNFIQGNVSGNVSFSKGSVESNSELHQVANQIQQILEHLDEKHDKSSSSGKMQLAAAAIETIEGDLTLRQRIISAVKVGGVSAIEQLLSHPASSFVIAAIQDWQKTSKSS